ncbi:MAG: ATP-binding protein [Coleofasciculaceae cyanobacterium]
MTSIDDIIKCEINPFDRINIKPSNFWEEKQEASQTVNSIHQKEIADIEEFLSLVSTDYKSRTVVLIGDSGSGKSHLLGRLKRTLNPKAFFTYILCDWAESSYIWRHILRSTVDSLTQVPEGQEDSQLILWLRSLSAFTKRNLKQRIVEDNFWEILQSDRQKFIKHLKKTYRTQRIYNPDIFFGILHDLTNPELYDLACEWLRGDDLSEESRQILKVKDCIDQEDVAKNILANFGRISTETQPIVLCFDNLDSMPKLSDSFLDIQSLFDVNTSIHADYLKNFLVIVSAITNTWKRHLDRIQPADKAGIQRIIQLKRISLEQAEALWSYQLKPLHSQMQPKPHSSIFPLNQKMLEQNFPGNKTLPRSALILGRQEYQRYKLSLLETRSNDSTKITLPPIPLPEDNIQAEFQLLWQQEFNKIQEKINKITLIPAPELIRMLQEVLAILQVQRIKPKLLPGKFANNSLSYQQPGKQEQIGLVWTEDAHMRKFYDAMNACQKVIKSNLCQSLILLRAGDVGTPKLEGHRIYKRIFVGNNHHIKPVISSVHYLATYHSLVNSVLAGELVVTSKTLNLHELESLMRGSKILHKCSLLQNLSLVDNLEDGEKNPDQQNDQTNEISKSILNVIKTQGYMSRSFLIKHILSQSSQSTVSQIDLIIQQLYEAKQVQLINSEQPLESQFVCFVP